MDLLHRERVSRRRPKAGLLIAATDADTAGRRYAARLHEMATEAAVRFETILPPNPSYSLHSRDSVTGMGQLSGIA